MRWYRFGADFFVCDCEKLKMYWRYIEFFGKMQAGKDAPKMCRRINQRFPRNMKGSPMKHRPHAPSPDALGADQSNLPSPIKADLYRRLDPKVQAAYRPVDPRYERLPRFCWVLYGIAAVCLVLYIVQGASVAFSDWFNRTISAAGRTLLATLTNWLPFSLGEFCIFMLPVGLGLGLWYAIRHRCDTWRTAGVYIGILLSVVVSIFSVFVLNFSAGYRGSTLDVKLGLSQEKVSAEELYARCRKCIHATVTDVRAFSRVMDKLGHEYKILDDNTVDMYEKMNITKLALALAEEKCELLSVSETDESLESHFIKLIGGGRNE